jgi:hypothetical protein
MQYRGRHARRPGWIRATSSYPWKKPPPPPLAQHSCCSTQGLARPRLCITIVAMEEPQPNAYLAKNADAIWSFITKSPLQDYSFTVGTKAQRTLKELIAPKRCDAIFQAGCPASVNEALRLVLSSQLQHGSKADNLGIVRWIVKDWGHIYRGSGTIDVWMGQLDPFSVKGLDQFAQAQGHERIASWSKILAYANPKRHAIYDSRVAASLNCSLAGIKSEQRFRQPRSQNRIIMRAEREFKDNARPQCFGYFDYLDLLKTVVKNKRAGSILEAEMTLFANAEELVERRFSGSRKAKMRRPDRCLKAIAERSSPAFKQHRPLQSANGRTRESAGRKNA